MDERLRFLLYGTYDGVSRSSHGDDNIHLVLDNGDRVEIPRHFVKNASDFVEKNKIKLKDVIARIKQLDIGTRKVWLDEFLNKLGSDYGTLKYKDGYEQGKLEGLIEREKVTIPQFVADFITEQKKLGHTLSYTIDACMSDRVAEWYWDNSELFALAWINGYEVEKEKRYLVKMKGIEGHNSYLKYNKNLKHWFFGSLFIYNNDVDTRTYHTRKELEEAGFSEVFNSPLFEVEEVEDDTKI